MVHLPTAHFRSLMLRFLGDKDHERVCETVSKVDKSFDRVNHVSAEQEHCGPVSEEQGATYLIIRFSVFTVVDLAILK